MQCIYAGPKICGINSAPVAPFGNRKNTLTKHANMRREASIYCILTSIIYDKDWSFGWRDIDECLWGCCGSCMHTMLALPPPPSLEERMERTMIPPITTVQGPHIHFDTRSRSQYIRGTEKNFSGTQKGVFSSCFLSPISYIAPVPLTRYLSPSPSLPTYPHSCFPKILFHRIAPAKYSIPIPSFTQLLLQPLTPNRSRPQRSKRKGSRPRIHGTSPRTRPPANPKTD